MDIAPTFLLGTHRSGTTILGKLLSEFPSVAYAQEPRHIWSWKNHHKDDDLLRACDSDEKISIHIRESFSDYVSSSGAQRLVEKTPSNCLRVEFINEIFPDGRFIHLLRDGRSVLPSQQKIMQRSVTVRGASRRALQIPPWEWHHYLPQFYQAVRLRMTGEPLSFWGPRPPGYKQWIKYDQPHVVLAKQWVALTRAACESTNQLGESRYIQVRYEDLLADPLAVLRQCARFMKEDIEEEALAKISKRVELNRSAAWRNLLSQSTLNDVRPYMEPMLETIGYQW